MRIIKFPSERDEKLQKNDEKLDENMKYISGLLGTYLEDLGSIQNQMKECLLDEFGANGPIDTLSITKLARITSKFAHIQAENDVRKFPRYLQNCYNMWKKNRRFILEYDKFKKMKHAMVPARLVLGFFLNGENTKALVCLLHYIEVVPVDINAKEVALKWLIYVGETELASEKLKEWQMETSTTPFVEITKLYIEYTKTKTTRAEVLVKLRELAVKIKLDCTIKKSYASYDLLSYSCWICSTLSNVPVSGALEEENFPDRGSSLVEACTKAETVLRNRIPGLVPYQFDNTCSANISDYFRGKDTLINASEYVNVASSIGWMFELRRELAFANVATAQSRDALSAMILNWRVSIRAASMFRIMQSINTLQFYWSVVKEPESEDFVKLCRNSMVNLLSPEAMVVRCSTPLEKENRNSVRTPIFNRKNKDDIASARKKKDVTMMLELEEGMNDLEIAGEQPFHVISRNCSCFICSMYSISSSSAVEYMFAYCLHHYFSQEAMAYFDSEFGKIRDSIMPEQRLMFKDPTVRPRPPLNMNEVFGICAVRWISEKFSKQEKVDARTKEILTNATKILKYVAMRTIDSSLTLSHLFRQSQSQFEKNLSWVQPVVKKKFMKIGINCAVDIIRAVSPFGRRSKIPASSVDMETNSEDKARYQREIKCDIKYHEHALYREWRVNIFTFLGRTALDPWEKAYYWAESTSIGSRNAYQQKLGKCGKGIATICGAAKFKKHVQTIPEDMTVVQIATDSNGHVHLIKIHCDRDPIVMPIAHNSQMIEMMEKFTHLLMEDERIAKDPGDRTPVQFWDTRKAIDARIETLVDEIQENFLDVAAYLLIPSSKVGTNCMVVAKKIEKVTKGHITAGEAKEIVALSKCMDSKKWEKLVDRFCEMKCIEKETAKILSGSHKSCLKAMSLDDGEEVENNKKYTYLVICPELAQFCWERLPIFDNYPYVCRMISIHSMFLQLEALRNESKQVPLQIDVQKAYYVLDPENNLGETKRRMLEYINKFQWEGKVGSAPNADEVSSALENMDAFFYFGHGSGSKFMSRHTIKQTKCNAINLLMGCGSVRTVPQGLGFDGKSVLLDYVIARCPLVVGCLWTVTDGEIDRYLMRMVDECFLHKNDEGGVNKLRQLAEAMDEARKQSKLKYLTGAAVVMYGFPVVSKSEKTILTSEEILLKNIGQQAFAKMQEERVFDDCVAVAVEKKENEPVEKKEIVMKTPTRVRASRSATNQLTPRTTVPKTPSSKGRKVFEDTSSEDNCSSVRMTRSRSSRTPSRLKEK